MFCAILTIITEYHKMDRRAWNRSSEWLRIFQSIRKAFYAEKIDRYEYKQLMAELGID